MDEELTLIKKLDTLRSKHRELDDTIDNLNNDDLSDELHLRRLKKEKLFIREKIFQLEQVIYPDIIA